MKKALLFVPAAAFVIAGCNMMPSSQDSTQEGMMETSEMTGDDSMMMADDGVMVGGALMTPDRDIVENAMEANNVTTLVAAVQAAGLVETLQGDGPFTVFAPTNMAFEKLPDGTVETLLEPANKAQLTGILTYHVVPGRYRASDLTNGMKLKTVQGQELTVSVMNGAVTITDANGGKAMVETADGISSNGVTHVIDTVLMPR